MGERHCGGDEVIDVSNQGSVETHPCPGCPDCNFKRARCGGTRQIMVNVHPGGGRFLTACRGCPDCKKEAPDDQ